MREKVTAKAKMGCTCDCGYKYLCCCLTDYSNVITTIKASCRPRTTPAIQPQPNVEAAKLSSKEQIFAELCVEEFLRYRTSNFP